MLPLSVLIECSRHFVLKHVSYGSQPRARTDDLIVLSQQEKTQPHASVTLTVIPRRAFLT